MAIFTLKEMGLLKPVQFFLGYSTSLSLAVLYFPFFFCPPLIPPVVGCSRSLFFFYVFFSRIPTSRWVPPCSTRVSSNSGWVSPSSSRISTTPARLSSTTAWAASEYNSGSSTTTCDSCSVVSGCTSAHHVPSLPCRHCHSNTLWEWDILLVDLCHPLSSRVRNLCFNLLNSKRS